MSVTLGECVPGISSKKTPPANCASISCSLILLTQVRQQPGDTYSKSRCSPGGHAHVLLTRITAWSAGIRGPPPVAKSLHRPLQILHGATWYWCRKCLSQAEEQGFLAKKGDRDFCVFQFTSMLTFQTNKEVELCVIIIKYIKIKHTNSVGFKISPGKVQVNRLRFKWKSSRKDCVFISLVLAMLILTLTLSFYNYLF